MARALSGGMKRRLMIARALMHEPTPADPGRAHRGRGYRDPPLHVGVPAARSTAQGTTIILTTHYLEEAENLCRNIAIIDKGEVIVRDRMSEPAAPAADRELHARRCATPVAAAPAAAGLRP